MLSPEALERLALHNRGALKNNPESRITGGKNNARNGTHGKNTSVHEPALRIRGKKAEYVTLEEAVPGQVTKVEDGEFLLIKWRFKDLTSTAQRTIKAFPVRLKEVRLNSAENIRSVGFATLDRVHASRILFLDIETCGLSAAPLFLIGAAYFTGEDFAVLQLFARDYHEEKTLLSFFNRLYSQYDLLVTFNGKSFDLPFIITRGHENRIRIPNDVPHVDLLHEVRWQWRYRLPNCKLQTVERHIFDRKRVDDVPGSEIPQIYREFIKTGNAAQIKDILEHNVLDIITMIDIVMNLSDQQENRTTI